MIAADKTNGSRLCLQGNIPMVRGFCQIPSQKGLARGVILELREMASLVSPAAKDNAGLCTKQQPMEFVDTSHVDLLPSRRGLNAG